ncbi:hypothetical protein MHBO_001768 [Bonamia ostreae]|uniref:Uncharacterized protein n=1 Tax=Bonamia ostreae TaxID=126728 RepID=A0ABV2AK38_9EUKA
MYQNDFIDPQTFWSKELNWLINPHHLSADSPTDENLGRTMKNYETFLFVTLVGDSETYCDVKLENNNVNMKFNENDGLKKSHKFLFEILKKCPFMETATGEFPNLNVVHLRQGEAIYAHENYSKDQKSNLFKNLVQFVRQIFTALLLLKKRGVRILKHIDREMLVVDRHQQLKLKGFACDLIDEGDYKFFNKILAGLIYHIDPQARDPLLIDLMKSIVNNSSDENPLTEELLAHPYFRQNNHNRLPTLVSVFEGDCLFVCLSGTTVLRLGNVKANPEGVDLFDKQLKVVDNNTFKRDTSHLSVINTEVVGSKCVVIVFINLCSFLASKAPTRTGDGGSQCSQSFFLIILVNLASRFWENCRTG